jgi:regulator of sigma E protease
LGTFFWNLAAFIVTLGILITAHEFGHFWVARRCGVWVERFSIGFGPALWRKIDKQGTEFVIALIPFGGYVKMLDGRNSELDPSQNQYAFNLKSVGRRSAIIAAGPLANFLLSIFAYWLVFMHGVPSYRPIIGQIITHSLASQVDIRPAMELTAVDDIETTDWDTVRLALLDKIGEKSVTLTVTPVGENKPEHKILSLKDWHFDPEKQDPIQSLGIVPQLPTVTSVLATVQKNSAAAIAGLQPGDKILKIDGKPVSEWAIFVANVKANPEKTLAVEIERNGVKQQRELTPLAKSGKVKYGFVGVEPKVTPLPSEYLVMRQFGPIDAIGEAGIKSWQLTRLTLSMLGKLVTGDIKLNNLSGPISIAQGAGASAEYGVIYYLMFIALISINLGIINLLPLPVLDGGHLLFLLIEKIKGNPVSGRVQDLGYRIGSIALMLLMGLALFNDFSRL